MTPQKLVALHRAGLEHPAEGCSLCPSRIDFSRLGELSAPLPVESNIGTDSPGSLTSSGEDPDTRSEQGAASATRDAEDTGSTPAGRSTDEPEPATEPAPEKPKWRRRKS